MAKVNKSVGVVIFLMMVFCQNTLHAQSKLQKLYDQKKYTEVVALSANSDLTGNDYFVIGQSYLKLKDSPNALLMFKKSIDKGFRDGELYFAKGIAESNMEMFADAQKSFRTALQYMPDRKKVVLALATAYYNGGNLDSALAVNQRIEALWGDYYSAIYMQCVILFEQEKPLAAKDCYYQKLPVLKKDSFFYKKALEDIARLEWQVFNDYYKAEVALKNLIDLEPTVYEYNMMLIQLYNTMGKYAEAATIEDFVVDGYMKRKLAQRYYDKGAMLVFETDTSLYFVEIYRNFMPEKKDDCRYVAFFFNRDSSRPLGKTSACIASNGALTLNGFKVPEGQAPIVANNSLLSFYTSLMGLIFAPEPEVIILNAEE